MYFFASKVFCWKETTSMVFKCVLLFWISFNTIGRLGVGPLLKRDNNSVNSEVIVVGLNLYYLLVLLYRNSVFVIKLSYLLLCLVL
jgi:hypothetical protein